MQLKRVVTNATDAPSLDRPAHWSLPADWGSSAAASVVMGELATGVARAHFDDDPATGNSARIWPFDVEASETTGGPESTGSTGTVASTPLSTWALPLSGGPTEAS
jgi:hypothetical protein